MALMKHSYVFTHFEIGDCIICNGLVRNLLHKIDNITLICKSRYKESMQWMYRDAPNIQMLFFDGYEEAEQYIKENKPRPLLRYGFEFIIKHEHLEMVGVNFDAMYYYLANIPFHKRWDDFFVKRDIHREYEFFTKFNVKEKEYIFVHDVYSNESPKMNTSVISTGFPIIKPVEGMTDNIFDYLYLIENAREIHCVCSAFVVLVDSLTEVKCPLFFHKNRCTFREFKRWISNCKLGWNHVEYF